MNLSEPIVKIYLYKCDVDELLDSAPPEDSMSWNVMTRAQRNLFDALQRASVDDETS